MRNGNCNCCKSCSLSLRMFLPYLWGMETHIRLWYWLYFCLFLPYLWGMETSGLWCQHNSIVRSYRTYEEWKLAFLVIFITSNIVLTVPMRNGNHRWQLFPCNRKNVLTVPMRNGNLRVSYAGSTNTFGFLPYLWGMETRFSLEMELAQWSFLPYLWGMETHESEFGSSDCGWVLTVPMRNGN